MYKQYLVFAAVFAGLAVALGAFGAHGLENLTTDERILHSFRTGVQYQMYHVLGLFVIGILFDKFTVKWMKWAANSFIAGILLFSGSLYLLTFLKIQESNMVKYVGPITPLGGLFFIAGWLFLILAFLRKTK